MKRAALLLLAALAFGGCRERSRLEILTGEAMGTTYRIKVVDPPQAWQAGLEDLLEGLDQDLSTWRTDSWVSRFNQAPPGASFDMPPAVAELLEISAACHAETAGRFDPTIGALIRLWGFGAWGGEWQGEPAGKEISAAGAASGFRHLRVDGRRLTKLHSGLMLDFSGIAKGYAVDRMGEILQRAGCKDFLIEFGGDLRAWGNAPGKSGWTIHGPAFPRAITLRNQAVATSGSEHRARDGTSHVIDPLSGRPLAVGPPVSVVANTCAEADARATARLIETAR